MVYDCIMFNDELDVLELRLTYMSSSVDRFVIGESSLTYSNLKKPLILKQNFDRFSVFKDKILYVEIPPMPQKDGWEGEFYQRNYLKTALKNCNPDDVIIIADVDELVNLEDIQKTISITAPALIEMSMYYYFLNLKTKASWLRTLITPYAFIENFDIGDRLKYTELKPAVLKSSGLPFGWHFSYLFGWNPELYVSKLKSFAHQEFNTPYYLDAKRIRTCLQLGIDFLERYSIYKQVELRSEVTPALYRAIESVLPLNSYLHRQPKLSFYFQRYQFKYYLKFVIKLKLSTKIRQFLRFKNRNA